jgi:hypothetical protein
MVEEQWSLERFCLSDEMKDFYRQFLWGFPLNNFEFIGITEFYDEDFAYFRERYLGTNVEAERLNVSDTPHSQSEIDGSLRRKIVAHHRGDMDLYEAALHRRIARCRNGRANRFKWPFNFFKATLNRR